MSTQGPAAQMEARANRAQQKLHKVKAELRLLYNFIRLSELPPEVKIRLFGAIEEEGELLAAEDLRLNGMRKAAEISRGRQWVTRSDDLGDAG